MIEPRYATVCTLSRGAYPESRMTGGSTGAGSPLGGR
jgi:hypothetical protein